MCHSWLASCRRLLYRDVTIKSPLQLDAFGQTLKSSTYLQHYVQTLRVDRTPSPYTHIFPIINNILAPKLVRQLPLVHTLELIRVDEGEWQAETFRSLACWTSIIKLSIVRCSLTPDTLINLISTFPSLQVLRIDDLPFCQNLRSRAYRLQSDARITTLPLKRLTRLILNVPIIPKYNAFGGNSLFEWILNSKIDTLKELYLGVSIRDARIRGRFLRALGPHVRHLELGFHNLVRQLDVFGKPLYSWRT